MEKPYPENMCGRYSIAIEPTEVEEHFGARFAEPMQRRYNAAPSQRLPVILNADPRSIVLAPWGIKPPWLVKRDGLINVRAETLREKHTFQQDLSNRRFLIPADGFYEWQMRPNGKKAPYRIVRRAGRVFAFAGIWEVEKQADAPNRALQLSPLAPTISCDPSTFGCRSFSQPIRNVYGSLQIPLCLNFWRCWSRHSPRICEPMRFLRRSIGHQ